MLGWLKNLFEGQGVAQAAIGRDEIAQADEMMAAGREEIGGLNFKTAIEAHVAWKIRLRAVIDGTSQEQLEPQLIARDDQCVLGKWLHGDGAHAFGTYPSFKSLCDEHARFHRCAADVLMLAQGNKQGEALQAIEQGGYREASVRVTGELARLFVSLRHA